MRPMPVAILLSCSLTIPLAAQGKPPVRGGAEAVIEAGRQYPGGTRVAAPAAGVSFLIPAGYAGVYDAGAQAFLMAATAQPNGLVGVLAFSEGSHEEIAEVLLEILTAQGIELYPKGELTSDGTTMSATYTAMRPQGPSALYGTIRLGQAGNAIAILSFGPPTEEAKVRANAETVLNSARFGTPLAYQWRAQLGGTRLTKGSANSTYSPGGGGDASFASQDQTRYDFCSNGQYAYYSRSESYLSVEGAGSMNSVEHDEHQGRWRLVADIVGGVTLVLEATDGREFYLQAEEGEDAVLIDGTSYGYSSSPVCN